MIVKTREEKLIESLKKIREILREVNFESRLMTHAERVSVEIVNVTLENLNIEKAHV